MFLESATPVALLVPGVNTPTYNHSILKNPLNYFTFLFIEEAFLLSLLFLVSLTSPHVKD